MIDWAREIRRYRESHGLLQQDLAANLGVSQATISRWESGRQRPDIDSQKTLRPLIWDGLVGSDALLLHAVATAPTITALCDHKARLLAVSPSVAEAFDIQILPGTRTKLDMERISPGGHQVFRAARDGGLFEGLIASISFRCLAHARDGVKVCDELWYPLRLHDGEVVVRADAILRGPTGEAEILALEAPPQPQITWMEDLLHEDPPPPPGAQRPAGQDSA